jgi:hypothetical protein
VNQPFLTWGDRGSMGFVVVVVVVVVVAKLLTLI